MILCSSEVRAEVPLASTIQTLFKHNKHKHTINQMLTLAQLVEDDGSVPALNCRFKSREATSVSTSPSRMLQTGKQTLRVCCLIFVLQPKCNCAGSRFRRGPHIFFHLIAYTLSHTHSHTPSTHHWQSVQMVFAHSARVSHKHKHTQTLPLNLTQTQSHNPTLFHTHTAHRCRGRSWPGRR